MILVTGGAHQGKEAFARTLPGRENQVFADGAVCGAEDIRAAGAVRHVHLFTARCLREGLDAGQILLSIADDVPDLLVITDEIGCGIVPADPEDRRWREEAGRLACLLASRSGEVWRVICGIGTRLR